MCVCVCVYAHLAKLNEIFPDSLLWHVHRDTAYKNLVSTILESLKLYHTK